MKNYQYSELIEIVKEVFSDFRRDAAKVGENTIHVLARFFDNYDCVIKEGECEAAIVSSTLCIELADMKETSIYRNHYKKLMEILNCYDSSKMAGYINENEVKLLDEQVEMAIQILEGMMIIN